jgi:glyoxylase-like metal-dependent hydrolase (beta-lactamase superfamily II)
MLRPLLATLALFAVVGLGCATTKAAPATSAAPCACCAVQILPEGYAPFGQTKVWPLPDGQLQLKPALFQGLPVEEKLRILEMETEEGDLPTSLNAFLVESEGHRILIDAGAGSLWGPSVGQLASAMAAKGIAPESIHAVLLTHLHGDHFGGLLTDDAPGLRFPNATVWLHEAELAFWTQSPDVAPAEHREAFAQTHAGVKRLVGALGDKLKTFGAAEQVLFPGVKAVHAPGHTPGHSVFLVESEGKTLLVWGDLVHNIRLQTAVPTAFPVFDVEPPTAVATRLQWMEKAVEEGLWVAGMHLPHPGIGRLRKQDDGTFRFIPMKQK